jgi:hypothetical protein
MPICHAYALSGRDQPAGAVATIRPDAEDEIPLHAPRTARDLRELRVERGQREHDHDGINISPHEARRAPLTPRETAAR